jgi:transcriptional regulator with PAS, ATPase and Fis domain
VFETAHGGTLFLDEIGEMPLGLQPSCFGCFRKKPIMQIGGVQDIP